MNKYIIFNINTGTGINGKDYIKPFNPEDVKVGNMVDKAKIDAKIKQSMAIYYKQAEEKLALYAITGRVLVISYYDSTQDKLWNSYINNDTSEEDIIKEFWSICNRCENEGIELVGFRSNYFDIPFLTQRSFILNIPMSSLYRGKWLKDWVVDCYDLWMRGSSFNNREDSFVRNDMKSLAKSIGIEIDKTISVKFEKYFINELPKSLAYCEDEINITKQFYLRLNNFIEPLKIGDIIDES